MGASVAEFGTAADRMRTGNTYYLLLLLLVTIFWGAAFPLTKIALMNIGPLDFLIVKFAVSVAVMLPFVLRRKQENFRKTFRFGIVAGFLLFLGTYFQTVGLVYTTPAKSAIITGLAVVMLPLISHTYLKVRADRTDVFASIFAFAGLIVMSVAGLGSSQVQLGDFLTLFCAIAYAYQISYVSKHSSEVDATNFTFYQLLFSSLFSIAAIPVYDPGKFIFTPFIIFAIIFTAIFGGTLAEYVSTRALKYVETTTTGVIFVSEPVFAAIFSVIFTKEFLSYSTIAGGSMMVLAMFIVTYRKYRAERVRREPVNDQADVPLP